MSVELNVNAPSRIASVAGLLTVGRDERYWDAPLEALPSWDGLLQVEKLIVLAPHPDDEILACAGLIQRCARNQQRIELWMITDGEGCRGATANTRSIARLRRDEAREAYRRLDLARDLFEVRWLGLPDGKIAQHAATLHLELAARLNENAALVAPLAMDGHGDNDAVGAVARQLAQANNLPLLSYPVWLWHWGDADSLRRIPGDACRLALTAAEELRKREAIAAFHSQIYPVERDAAVLPRRVLRHFRRSFEVFFRAQRPNNADSQSRLRFAIPARPISPTPNSAKDAGSGTGVVDGPDAAIG